MAYEAWVEPDVEDTSVPWAYGDTWRWTAIATGGHPWGVEPLPMLYPGWWSRV